MITGTPSPVHRSLTTISRAGLAVAAATALVASAWQATAPAAADTEPTPVTPEVERLAITPTSQSSSGRSAEPVLAEFSVDDRSFSTFGVTWSSGDVPTIEYRVLAAGDWSDWDHLHIENDGLGGEEGVRPGSDPVFTGDAEGLELRVFDGLPADLAVDLIDAGTSAADADLTAATTETRGAPTPRGPAIINRAAWGADERIKGSCSKRYGRTIRGVVVHHTAGTNNYTAAQSAGILRGIYAFHVNSRGYCDIAYNFLTDKYGRIFEGRAGGTELPVHGGHARDWNSDTVGVSMMGNHSTAAPTSAAFEATASIIAWKLDGNYRDPRGNVTLAGKRVNTIFTHGDVVNTDCPGRFMDARMGELRNRVASKMGSWRTGNWEKWQALGGESGWVGSPFRLEKPAHGGSVTQFTNADILGKNGRIHYVKGMIRTKYRELGSGGSRLGFPTSDEYTTSTGAASNFEGGKIIWTRSSDSVRVTYN